MRRLKTYELFENAKSGLTPHQIDILNRWTSDGVWTYDEERDLVNVDGDLYIFNNKDSIGIKFGRVTGLLDCSSAGLETLEGLGLPDEVGGDFDCSANELKNLKGGPKRVDGSYNCYDTGLVSLEGSPVSVGGNFDCSGNNLLSLERGPKQVGGYYQCSNNQLKNLKGSIEECKFNFNCSKNTLKTLEGGPRKVGGSFDCDNNELTSLKGSPEEVDENFSCENNDLLTFEGAPKKIDGMFFSNFVYIENGDWNVDGFLEEILKDDDDTNRLLAGIMNPEELSEVIKKDAPGTLTKLIDIWDLPEFQKCKSKLKIPSDFGDVEIFMRALKRKRSIEGLI